MKLIGLKRWNKQNVIALCVLVLTIAPALTIAGFFEQTLWKPLDFHDPDRLAVITGGTSVFFDAAAKPVNPLHSLAAIGLFASVEGTLVDPNASERIHLTVVSGNFFETLGPRVRLGHFEASKDSAAHAVNISEHLWRSRFNSDPNIAGRRLQINNKAVVVTAVVAGTSVFPEGTDVWMEARGANEAAFRGVQVYSCVVRLSPGVSMGSARAEYLAATELLNTGGKRAAAFQFVPLPDFLRDGYRTTAFTALTLVLILAFLGLINAAVLCGIELMDRQQEIAIRLAIGATPARIFFQVMAQQVSLTGLAALISLLATPFLLPAIAAVTGTPGAGTLTAGAPGWREWLIAGALACVFAAIAAAAQIVMLRSVPVSRALQFAGRTSGPSRAAEKFKGGLIFAQVSLTAILVLLCGHIGATYFRLSRTELGLRTQSVLSVDVEMPDSIREPAARVAFFNLVADRLRSTPRIETVAATNYLPLDSRRSAGFFVEPAEGYANSSRRVPASYRVIYGDYFQALQIPLLRGRAFNSRIDTKARGCVSIVNQLLADRLGFGPEIVGKSIRIRGILDGCEVVGIAGNVRHFGAKRDAMPELYVPFEQQPSPFMSVVVKTSLPLGDFQKLARPAFAGVDRSLIPGRIASMDQLAAAIVKPERDRAAIIAVVALLALTLTLSGVYGVVATRMRTRLREIAVRLAIGGGLPQVMWSVTRSTVMAALVAAALGNLATAAILPMVRTKLGLLNVSGWYVYPAFTAAFLVICLSACLFPARKASRVEPMAMLRE
ncbi:MAG TPA: ABC transporter permease [Bryobacteraceae bacterium]